MRYAVPGNNDVVATHFGHCQQFALIDVDEERKAIVEKEIVPSPEHEPGLFPQWLAEKGVSVVIACGMGSRAQNLFGQNRIKVVINVLEGDPEKVVLDYIGDTLETGDNVCDH